MDDIPNAAPPTPPPDERHLAAALVARMHALTPHTPLTTVLMAVNLAFFGVMIVSGVSPISPTIDALLKWGANFGPRTTSGEWWRLASCMFIHIGVIHVAMNMWVLSDIGRFVERLLGPVGFVAVYLLAGLGGSIASLAWNPFVVSAGASGAVFGLYGALLGYLVRQRSAIPRLVLKHLGRNAALFVLYNVVFGLSVPNIDNAAHLGGLASGFLLGLLAARPITRDGASRRMSAAIGVALAGGALVMAVAAALPRVADVGAVVNDYLAIERDVVDRFARSAEQHEANTLPAADFARMIENDLLPALRTAGTHLDAIDRVPRDSTFDFPLFRRYVAARREYLELVARALRTDDPAAEREADLRAKEIGSLIHQFDAAKR